MLGAFYAILSAMTFALNNTMARRGVLTGTALQAMAVTIPIGVIGFLLVAIVFGDIGRLPSLPFAATAWMAGVGLLHFVFGRYCNFSSNRAVGVNLSAPVVQLQVVVTLVLAAIVLHEPFTVLQMVGGMLILVGSLITQRQPLRRPADAPVALPGSSPTPLTPVAATPVFRPRYLAGYGYGLLAALAYGITPIMVRFAFETSGLKSSVLGGLIAYSSAMVGIGLGLLVPAFRREVMRLKPENRRWFAYSGVFVAVSQGLFYSALAVAPILLVAPIMQLSLVFRLILSRMFNKDHEVLGPLVAIGAAISIVGAIGVSVNTDSILTALSVPQALVPILRLRPWG